ncbi:hypothetical protein M1563_00930 [Patescibacteria group bacterium]|nr:hypothetical protein [Patescibacteria group bacterium]
MKNTRIILNKYHYILRAISLSDKYKRALNEITADAKSIGCPLPVKGFIKASDYTNWQEQIEKHGRTAHDYAQNVLKLFNLKTNDELLTGRLCMMMFLNVKAPPTIGTIGYSADLDNEKNEVNIKLTFYPWTTKEDFDGLEIWKDVESFRKMLLTPRHVTKNKEWKTFERDLKVYHRYQQLQKQYPKEKSVVHILLNDKKFEKFYESDDQANDLAIVSEQIYKIIKRCRTTLGNNFSTV